MKLQTKLLSSILAVGLTVALVGGSTMAWFTDTKTLTPPTFTAGTVLLDGTSTTATLTSPLHPDNLNPGDLLAGSFKIVNSGTKAVYIRVKIPDFYWIDSATSEHVHSDVTNIHGFTFNNSSKWTKGSDGYMYYTDVVLGSKADGTYAAAASLDASTITVTASATISGEDTDNSYEGDQLYVGNIVIESIQATNNANTSNNGGWATVYPAVPTPVA